MSVWKYVFDHDLLQRGDIEHLRKRTRSSEQRMRRRRKDVDARIETLEDEVGELTLLCQALLEVLRESGHLDADRLQAAMQRIDAADGVVDGKVTKPSERPREDPPPAPTRRRRRT